MYRLYLLACMMLMGILLASGCNEAGNSSEGTPQDTIQKKDTIASDPSKFSDPH